MTITEIAKKANVSIGTVDRVIHKRGRVSEKTREKIETIITESGYKPNPIARHLKKNRDYTIGVLLPRLQSESAYWQSLFDGICVAEQELSVFSIRIVLLEFDRMVAGDCVKMGTRLIKNTVDALIIAPVVPDEACLVLEILGDIPYVFVDSSLPNANPLVTVAQNPFKAGYCAARVMNLLRPRGECFICVQMHATAYNLTERSRGFMAYFARLAQAEVHHKKWNWPESENNYFAFLDSIFAEHPVIDGFFITNDSVYQLQEYITSRKKKKTFTVIGFDLQKNNIEGLLDDSIDMIISQQPRSQGYRAVNEIYRKIVLNQEPEKDIDINIEIYFKENLPEFTMG